MSGDRARKQRGCVRVGLGFPTAGASGRSLLLNLKPNERERAALVQSLMTGTICRFGGRRPWSVCSGRANGRYCGRRVGVVRTAQNAFLSKPHQLGLARFIQPRHTQGV
jgi:hypothetical protein